MHAVSEDGTTRVRAVVLDGVPTYYVERRSVTGWWLVGTALTAEAVAAQVDVSSLVLR